MVTQRSIAQLFLALQAALTAFLAVLLTTAHNPHALGAASAALAYGACWVAFRGGWQPARQVTVCLVTVLLIVATREPYLTQRPTLAVLVPPIVALMLTSSVWIVGSAAFGLLGLAARAHFETPLVEPLNLSELTKQLLAFARKQVLVKRTVELNELVANVERMLRRVIGEGTELVSNLSGEPLRVLADAGQIEQVIVNLVINARDAIAQTGRIEVISGRESR